MSDKSNWPSKSDFLAKGNGWPSLLTDQQKQMLMNAARQVACKRDDPLDVLQDAFVTVHLKLNDWDERGSFYSWCWKIIYSRARDRERKLKEDVLDPKLVEERMDAGHGSDDHVDRVVHNEYMEYFKAQLECIDCSEDISYLIVCRFYTDPPVKWEEIATERGVDMGTLKTRWAAWLKRARDKLCRAGICGVDGVESNNASH